MEDIGNNPTVLSRPSISPLNGKTKWVGGISGASVLAAIVYLFFATAQQPIIDSHQDAEINQIRTQNQGDIKVVIGEITHIRNEMSRDRRDRKGERKEILEAIREIRTTPHP